MKSAIPDFYELRLSLADFVQLFESYIGPASEIDIPETMALLLKDYFYGENAVPNHPFYFSQYNRVIVIRRDRNGLPLSINRDIALQELGNIFWTVADTITQRVLQQFSSGSHVYTHKPHECLYRFFPTTMALTVYVPVCVDLPVVPFLNPMDGRAVITTCRDFLPYQIKQLISNPHNG